MLSFIPAAFLLATVGASVSLEYTEGLGCPGDYLSFICRDNETLFIKCLINGIEVAFIFTFNVSAQRSQTINQNGRTTVMTGILANNNCPDDPGYPCFMEMVVTFPVRLDMKNLTVSCQSTLGVTSILVITNGKYSICNGYHSTLHVHVHVQINIILY